MVTTLTNPEAVRDRGALPGATIPGHLTDDQLNAAIILASHTMMVEACGIALYQSVLGLTETQLNDSTVDPTTGRTNAQKKADFIDAETYFALMHLQSTVAQTGRLTETGTPMTLQTGRDIKTQAPATEASDIASKWQQAAYRCLKPYLTLLGTDTQSNPTFVSNGRKTTIMSIF